MHASVVGGGLVGALAAVYLRRQGFAVEVWERREDPRRAARDEGRSINLVVTSRGIAALERVGLWDEMRKLAVPVQGRLMHDPQGGLAFQPYGRSPSEVNYSISRGELNRKLVEAAEARGAQFHFGCRLKDWDGTSLEFEGGAPSAGARSDLIFATDGAGSAARASMERRGVGRGKVDVLPYGYKELSIAAQAGGGFRLRGDALHIWPRGHFMMMALPNRDGSFTVTLYLPYEGPEGFHALEAPGAARRFFETHFPDALGVIDDLEGSWAANPVGSLATVWFEPWNEGRLLLLGDAAHGIVPFFGQGMNSGFEDLLEWDLQWEAEGWRGEESLRRLFERRKGDTDAIATMALENFVEMRDRVGDPAFRLRKAVEGAMEARFPQLFRSRYGLVAYTLVPYREALRRGQVADAILSQLCEGITGVDAVDWKKAERLLHQHFGEGH